MMKDMWIETYPKVLWLVGQQCVGKTMLARVFDSCGATVLNIGEALRNDHTIADFLNSENPYAPSFVEQRVQGMLTGAIHNIKRTGGTLVIDSAPRNVHQLPILASVTDISTVIFMFEEYELRRIRARIKYGNDLSLFEKREAFEHEWIAEFVKTCVNHNIDHVVLPGGHQHVPPVTLPIEPVRGVDS